MKKYIVGKILYNVVKYLPASDSKISLGGRMLRGIAGKMILNKCGKKINIDRNASIGKNVSLGDYSGIGRNSIISDYTSIGKYVMMGPECYIYTRNHSLSNCKQPMCFQGFDDYKPVIIGDDVWIGARVTILPGVKIESGAVIGAGSVVTKDVKTNSIVAGNPAKFIRFRKNNDDF